MGCDTANVDDVTAVARFHSLRHDLGQCHDCKNVRLQHLLCIVEVALIRGINTQRESCVVDEDVNLPELARQRWDQLCQWLDLANVQRDAVDTGLRELGQDGLLQGGQAISPTGDEDQLGASVRHPPRDRLSDASRGACDEGNLPRDRIGPVVPATRGHSFSLFSWSKRQQAPQVPAGHPSDPYTFIYHACVRPSDPRSRRPRWQGWPRGLGSRTSASRLASRHPSRGCAATQPRATGALGARIAPRRLST